MFLNLVTCFKIFFTKLVSSKIVVMLMLLSLTGCEAKTISSSTGDPEGNVEISATESHQMMLDRLRAIGVSALSDNIYIGRARYKELLAKLNEGEGEIDSKLLAELGREELQLGLESDSIAHLEKALLLSKKGAEIVDGPSNLQILYLLGIAYMRLAETENCCAINTPESCILPIRGGGLHTKKFGATKAISCFSVVIKEVPAYSEGYFRCVWLLNVANMLLDQYPDKVDDQYLIPPSYFTGGEKFPHFKNISKERGVNTFSSGGGLIVDDFDNDGDFDLMTSGSHPDEQMRILINVGADGFVDKTAESNLTGILGGINLVQADYNNDGWVDVFVARGGWFKSKGKHPNSLLRNNGDGTFTDVTFKVGLAEENFPTHAVAWADYDLDGDLDLYVGNEPCDGVSPSQLFRNNGDETFTDVASIAGVTNERYPKGVVWGDYNNDGYSDIYVSNLGGKNRLYQNNGDGTFRDVADAQRVAKPINSFPCWFWDYDNDGKLDLYVSCYSGLVANVAAHAVGKPYLVPTEMDRLYKNSGLTFRDVSEVSNLTTPTSPMGCNFGDLNGDGYLDFHLGTGDPSYDELTPNVMYVSDQGGGFKNVTMSGGFGLLQKGHGTAFADMDRDGDQDLLVQMGGAFLGDNYYDAYFENPGFGHSWISLKLIGVKTNRSAIGARIHLRVEEGGAIRSIYRHVNSGGSFGANPLEKNIGIGKASKIISLQVLWPVTGETQEFKNVPINQRIELTEGELYKVLK